MREHVGVCVRGWWSVSKLHKVSNCSEILSTMFPLSSPPTGQPNKVRNLGQLYAPVQQKDCIFPRSSSIRAIKVSSVVVTYRLQEGPQLGMVMSQLGAVDRTTHHTSIGIRLWKDEMEQNEPAFVQEAVGRGQGILL